MLGLTVPDKNVRRSHSVIMSAASDTENPLLSTLAASARPSSNTNRPSSLPPNSQLSEVLSALTADVSPSFYLLTRCLTSISAGCHDGDPRNA